MIERKKKKSKVASQRSPDSCPLVNANEQWREEVFIWSPAHLRRLGGVCHGLGVRWNLE